MLDHAAEAATLKGHTAMNAPELLQTILTASRAEDGAAYAAVLDLHAAGHEVQTMKSDEALALLGGDLKGYYATLDKQDKQRVQARWRQAFKRAKDRILGEEAAKGEGAEGSEDGGQAEPSKKSLAERVNEAALAMQRAIRHGATLENLLDALNGLQEAEAEKVAQQAAKAENRKAPEHRGQRAA